MASKHVAVPPTLLWVRDGIVLTLTKQQELGRGGFAVVYRVTCQETGEEFALKCIARERVAKPKTMEKLQSEIEIQSSIEHPNCVQLFGSFEDVNNFYIVLELCAGRTVKDLLKRYGRLSEEQTRDIMRDVLEGLCHLHDNLIIHRDLKLENFLIGAKNEVKIGDFGLSARLRNADDRKHTICGTPNYLCPELLSVGMTSGHSYEVDIWTIGVCVFTMLTGRPPFDAERTRLTYEYIKTCSYRFPPDMRLSAEAKSFVCSILRIDPGQRPSAQDLRDHPFVRGIEGYEGAVPGPQQTGPLRPLTAKRVETPGVAVNLPSHCVARFCDHSDKYGLGYLLLDGTVGACFNDLSRMVMDPHERFVQYWPDYQAIGPDLVADGQEAKKVNLLKRFSESLKRTASMFDLPSEPYDAKIPCRHVKYWLRRGEATLFRMDDRNIQVNFSDRVKLVIFWATRKMALVHNIKETARLLSLDDVAAMPVTSDEAKRFAVAKDMLAEMSGR